MRLGTAHTYDAALELLMKRQVEMSGQQEKLTSGKRINRASDDPTGASQAERALTRLSRVETDQRSLELQRNALTVAESTLGESTSLIQRFRELVVSAGNTSYNTRDRETIALQLTGLRDQIFSLANKTDSNGIPLFGGLGSAGAPFVDATAGVAFQGIPGQRASTGISVPGAMDGQAIWMKVPSGNGVFNIAPNPVNTGIVWTDTGQVTNPGAVTGDNYAIAFSVVAGVTTYSVTNTTTATTVATGQPFVSGQAITFDGLSMVVSGTPQNADSVQISPSTTMDMFAVLDDAISGIRNATTGSSASQAVAQALTQIDSGMDRLQAAQGQAGEWLNRADTITDAQARQVVQLEADRSRAEDLDMVKGISDFQKTQTGYQAALQSYAQVQKLSLFNFIN
jgi:flagellar hook-associated protein 3 FlgL